MNSDSRSSPQPRRAVLACVGLLLLVAAGGCSSFERDWRRAAKAPATPPGFEGRWEGSWLSDVNQHTGSLRALVTQTAGDTYETRYRATYARVLRFSYRVPVAVGATNGLFQFNGQADLGKLAGGVYRYTGHATATNFFSTYESKYDHGTFQMTRPK